MQYLAAFLTAAFNGLLTYLSNRFTKTVGMTIFVAALISSLALGLYAALRALTTGISYFITNKWVLMGMGILWPSNAEACITAILTAELAVYVFRFKKSLYLASLPK